ncbi:hypothetical protein BCR43DRAFT_509124 [Syncephalastrum racemosum]|uniref:Uncharacterized protein n=1 Tax=Syncephalastrum racemosum TaxID=13706 RepID=A0A1X2GZF1_SYNRA|nr:hypothetical protein BCR43DRAFT_509124 [Syncephalastrum racemosum]
MGNVKFGVPPLVTAITPWATTVHSARERLFENAAALQPRTEDFLGHLLSRCIDESSAGSLLVTRRSSAETRRSQYINNPSTYTNKDQGPDRTRTNIGHFSYF